MYTTPFHNRKVGGVLNNSVIYQLAIGKTTAVTEFKNLCYVHNPIQGLKRN